MRAQSRILVAFIAAAWLAAPVPAPAIIKITFPVSRVYQEAGVVAIGAVAPAGAGQGLECVVRETLKGDQPDSKLRLDVPGELLREVKTARPAVLFIQGERAIIHVADAWYEASRGAGGSLWRIANPYPMVKNYPGRTEGLVGIVKDADGDRLPDAVALGRTGRLSVALNPGDAAARWKERALALWDDGAVAQAAVFSQDWGDDGALYALVVHARDIVRYPVGCATAPRSDFKRLTGIALTEYPKIGPMPLRVELCTELDYDGNGRQDLVLLTAGGGITLANRGYGAMLINGFLHSQLRADSAWTPHPRIPKLAFEVNPSVCVAPAKRAGRTGKGNAQNLFILRGDGRLFELINDR